MITNSDNAALFNLTLEGIGIDARSKKAAKEREKLLKIAQKHQADHKKVVEEINADFQKEANRVFEHYQQIELCINSEVSRYITALADTIANIEVK